jgi:hypothetical protein
MTTQTRFREYSNRFTSLKKNHLSLLSRSSFYETRPGHGYNTNPTYMNNTTAHRRKNNVIRLVTQKEQGNTVRRTMQVEVLPIICSYHTRTISTYINHESVILRITDEVTAFNTYTHYDYHTLVSYHVESYVRSSIRVE